jgi:transmembrane sensor
MERNIKELLQKGSERFIEEREQQEIFSLFHQEETEFNVKAELTDILDNTSVTNEEGMEINHLFEKIWRKICDIEEMKKKRVISMVSILKIAASLLLGLLIGSLVFPRHGKKEEVFYTSLAPKGSVSQMILPDSTFICLNSGSTLKYAINGQKGKREVFLDGEAWFQVQRSEDNTLLFIQEFMM